MIRAGMVEPGAAFVAHKHCFSVLPILLMLMRYPQMRLLAAGWQDMQIITISLTVTCPLTR